LYNEWSFDKVIIYFYLCILYENIIIYKFNGSPRGTTRGNASPSLSLFIRRRRIFLYLHPHGGEPSPSSSPNGGITHGESRIEVHCHLMDSRYTISSKMDWFFKPNTPLAFGFMLFHVYLRINIYITYILYLLT
jgi:hypothetical protein